MKKKIAVECPCCQHHFEVEVNPAALLASGTTAAKNAALKENAKKTRTRARAFTPEQIEVVKARIQAGEKRTDIAKEYGVTLQTLRNYFG